MSYLYILTNQSFNNLIKIGYTSKNPHVRAAELQSTGVPTPFYVFKYWEIQKGLETERDVHRLFSKYRHANNREFFKISPKKAETLIEKFLIGYDEIVREKKAKEKKKIDLRKIYHEWRKVREEVKKECWRQVEKYFGISYEQCLKNSNRLINTPIIGLIGIFYTPQSEKEAKKTLSLMLEKYSELYRTHKVDFFKSISLECKIYSGGWGDDEFTFIDEYIIHEYHDIHLALYNSINNSHNLSSEHLSIELASEYWHENYLKLKDDIKNTKY